MGGTNLWFLAVFFNWISRLLLTTQICTIHILQERKMNSEFLENKEIIVASNRGPVVLKKDDKGKIELIRGAGGIVGSMIPFLKKTHGKWVFICNW